MVRFGIAGAAGRWRALLPAFVRRTANHLLLWPVLLGLSVLQISSGAAEENDGETDFAQFSAHDEASKIVIDYGPWNIVLRSLIRVTGPSNRFNPRLKERHTGTRIKLGNRQPSWLEGNRLHYELLKDEHLAAISEYRRELEMLPRQFGGLGNLSRREQLAYWLNLYNVTIIEQVGYRYPIVNLRRFHLGSRKRPGLLDKKLLTVMGARLSLNDIQNRILIPVFENPLVLYGLHQGVVGSPNIRRTAYRGGNVWDSLRLNAIDFVNSIRGVHLRKNVARASEFYARGAAAFPQGLPGLRRHLVAYADDRTQEILDAAGKIETNYFDWHIADLYNGRPNPVSIYANSVTDLSGVPRTLETRIPDHVQRYLAGLKMKFLEFGYPRTTVTIEDRPRNENAIDSALENKNEDDENSNQQNFFRLR